MRILDITAGAAQMYCGSCLRDNALATELLARGHDVLLVPMYTPTLTDEPNVSGGRVFFGGISVYLQNVVPAREQLRGERVVAQATPAIHLRGPGGDVKNPHPCCAAARWKARRP